MANRKKNEVPENWLLVADAQKKFGAIVTGKAKKVAKCVNGNWAVYVILAVAGRNEGTPILASVKNPKEANAEFVLNRAKMQDDAKRATKVKVADLSLLGKLAMDAELPVHEVYRVIANAKPAILAAKDMRTESREVWTALLDKLGKAAAEMAGRAATAQDEAEKAAVAKLVATGLFTESEAKAAIAAKRAATQVSA